MRFSAAILALAVAVGWVAPAAAEDDPPMIAFYGGAANAFDSDDIAAMAGVEWRSDFRQLILTPMAGGFVTSDGSLYGYGGLFIDIHLTDQFVVRPSASVGAYSEGNGRDLGGWFEFRTGVEVAWRFEDLTRLGIEFTHISNAGIYDVNPGTEMLTINYSVPLGSLF